MTLTRIYIPLNVSGLQALATHREVAGAPFLAHAVTEAVRVSAPTAGQDQWEYVALSDAVQRSATLLATGESRRIVAAADVPSELVDQAAPDDNNGESAVMISDSVALKRIASIHVDAGDASEDDELQWFDVTELPVILALL